MIIIKTITMGLLKFISKGGVKDVVKIAKLVKASKVAKAAAAAGVVASVTPEAPVDPKTALLVSAISMIADMLISYVKGLENKKKDA